MKKGRFKLIAFIGFVVILLCCLFFKIGPIEEDLFARTNSALIDANLQGAKVLLDGRDVFLDGTVQTEQIKNKAGLIAGNIWGVNIVHNNLIVKEIEREPPKVVKNEKIKKVLKDFSVANIEFESGKSIIKSESYHILDDLSDILKEYPDVRILIGGHTDSSGNENVNIRLSKKRAEAVKAYLLKKGINKNRLTAKGFGSSKPITENTTVEGRKKNRRVEFNLMEAN